MASNSYPYGGSGASESKRPSHVAHAEHYYLRNRSSTENFHQRDTSCNGANNARSNSHNARAMTSDALALHGVVKLSDGDYELNGIVLSEEELNFVLENAIPQESSTSYKSHGRHEKRLHDNASSSLKKLNRSVSNACAKHIKFRDNPSTPAEKVLAKFTKDVAGTPAPGAAAASAGAGKEADCSICLSPCHEESPYQSDKETSRDIIGCVALSQCGHEFHACCLLQLVSQESSSISCPNCKTIHGVLTGTQPRGGTMAVSSLKQSLPGHPKTDTIVVSYSFPSGVQGPEHPNPGQNYLMVGFPRVGYFPDTPKGNKVLALLRKAFDRRLVFTVGTSATTGHGDCVVWNGIHHKTEFDNSYGHGYPDSNYLDNVTMELAAVGVTEDS